jgi:hypothetical protein
MLIRKDHFERYMVHGSIVMIQYVHYPIEIIYLVEIILLIEVAFDMQFVEHFVVIYYPKRGFSTKIMIMVY